MAHPIYTFQVNLQNPGLFPSRYQTDQDLAVDNNNAFSDTRSIGIPGVGFFKHGEKFTVEGKLAEQIFALFIQTGNPGVLVVCSADPDENCVPDTDVGTVIEGTQATATATMQAVSASVVNTGGSIGYDTGNEMTLVGGTFTTAAILVVDTVETIATQTHSNFSGSEGDGSFVAGTGYTVNDVNTMSDGTTVTVDGEAGGAVTSFTITTKSTTGHSNNGDTLTQNSSTGEGATGFSLTLANNNQAIRTATFKQIAELPVSGDYTVLPSDPVAVTDIYGSVPTFNMDWGLLAITVTDGGSGYTSDPAVTFDGDGTATAFRSGDTVNSVAITPPQSTGYSARAVVTIAAP